MVHLLHMVGQLAYPDQAVNFVRDGWRRKYGQDIDESRLTYLLFSRAHAPARTRSRARALAHASVRNLATAEGLLAALRLQRQAEAALFDLLGNPKLRRIGRSVRRLVSVDDKQFAVTARFNEVDAVAVKQALAALELASDAVVRQQLLARLTGQAWPPQPTDLSALAASLF